MRLTQVAHLRLGFGPLLSYDVVAGPPAAERPVSFDQGRHVALGDRPGSWMAITIRLPHVDLDALEEAWLRVVARHGTLRTVFTETPAGPRLHEVEVSPGAWVEHDVPAGSRLSDAIRRVLDEGCTSYDRPSYRLCVVRSHDRPTVVLGFDHAHVDMWSLLVVVRDLVSALEGHELAPDPRTFADHTASLRERPSAPVEVRERWREILEASGDVMPCFPLPLGDVSEPVPERVEVRDVLDVDAAATLALRARELRVSTLALVTSVMTEVNRRLADVPLRAVFPVHSRYDPTWHDSVGWFITNAVLDSPDADPRSCADAVKDAIRLGSYPLADVLAPWGGMPQAPGMFAISWLDMRRLPVRVDHVALDAQYVSAAGRTDGVMVWFVLDEGGMHLRCRYPDTVEARSSVGRWLDAVVDGVRERSLEVAGAVGGRALVVDGTPLSVERAVRGDVPAIVAMLANDPIGSSRESPDVAAYDEAFDTVSRDPAQLLAVVRDGDVVVATMQLSIIPGLSRRGATRLQIEAVRVALRWRSRGLGTALMEWAHEHGRSRGATLSQLTSDVAREDAHRFYRRLGYERSHVGFKRPL